MSESVTPSANATATSWLRELARILLRHRWLLLAVVVFSIIGPILEPAQSWVAKTVLDKLTKKDALFSRQDLLAFVPLLAAVFAGLASIRLVSHLLDKVLDAKLKIDFQRFYFQRHLQQIPGEDVARTIYDCDQARKIVDILQRDIWVVLIGLPAVLVWQIQLASQWILPLVLAATPSLAFTVLLGPAVRRWSRRRLESIAAISGAVCRNDRNHLHESQAVFYQASVRFEISKKAAEVLGELMLWLGLAVVLLSSRFVPILPNDILAGDLAAFVVNLKLLGKPLQEVGKIYVKVHESYPAVLRVFRPGAPTIRP